MHWMHRFTGCTDARDAECRKKVLNDDAPTDLSSNPPEVRTASQLEFGLRTAAVVLTAFAFDGISGVKLAEYLCNTNPVLIPEKLK